jgi:hypothetical protein
MSDKLLPQDRYLAQLLGLTEDELRYFKAEVQRRAAEGPQPAVVAGLETAVITAILINTAISIGLTLIATLLMPRPKTPGQLTTRQVGGDTLRVPAAFAPTYGFESVQDIAPLGDPIPLVYTKREFLNGQWYGGVRVSTPLLWSQIWSLGGSQLMRAVFLVSEGEIDSIHPNSFAIGNNTLAAYALEGNTKRVAIYWRPDGGRMSAGNLLAGATDDIGARGSYAPDIFRVDAAQGALISAFCGAYKPSTSTSFGVYAPIANGLGYRVNPQIRPLRQLQSRDEEYDARDDAQAIAGAWKYKYIYSSKSGVIFTSKGSAPGLQDLVVGDTFQFMLSRHSDGVLIPGSPPPEIVVRAQNNSDNKKGSQDGEETLIAVGGAVAGRQKQYDASLVEGELYKIGSCLAILVSRSPLFVSEADYSVKLFEGDSDESGVPSTEPPTVGSDAFYTFRVVRAGTIGVVGQTEVERRFFTGAELLPRATTKDAGDVWNYQTVGLNLAVGQIGSRHYTASAFPQLYRCSLGGFTINRRARFFEVGLKSVVGINIQGICNFADIPTAKEVFVSSVTALVYVSRSGTTLANNTYAVTATGGSGTGLTANITTVSGTPTSIAITNGGSGYKLNQQVTFTTGGASFVYRISALEYISQSIGEVSGYEAINWKAADSLDGKSIERSLSNAVYSSGSLAVPEKRYSFFRVLLRSKPDQNTVFETTGSVIFGVSSAKQTAVFNFLRFRMKADACWEVRFEPITSWELRNQDFTYVLLETGNTDVGVNAASVALPFSWGDIYAQGRILDSEDLIDIFKIKSLSPQREVGISWTEGDYASAEQGTYIDEWARVAEAYVYDEIKTSCDSSPEHEITYVNVIQENESVPQYDNMSLLGVNIRASQEWSQFSQFSCYVTGGIKVNGLLGGYDSTHLFPEILYDFMLNSRYGLGNEISPNQIDVPSFTAAAQYCLNNRFFYDGPKLSNTNWRQWAADVAATHALLLIERGGVFFLEQAIPEKPVIKGMFTAGNCISLELQVAEAEQREPFAVSVKYRTERYRSDSPLATTEFNYGVFPEPQERLIYHTTWGNGAAESIDVSDYCTSETHAIRAARYVIGARRLSDHTVKIKTTHEALTSPLAPGDFIKVALDYTHYSSFNNGVVTSDGSLVSSSALADGQHQVLLWNGDNTVPVAEGVLTVSGGGKVASPAGVIFTVKTTEIMTRTYRIDSIQPSEDGFDIDAIHTPLLADGTLQLYAEWSNDSYWTVA